MDVLNNITEIATGKQAVKFEVSIADEDLTKLIVGVSLALALAIAVGIFLAKKVR